MSIPYLALIAALPFSSEFIGHISLLFSKKARVHIHNLFFLFYFLNLFFFFSFLQAVGKTVRRVIVAAFIAFAFVLLSHPRFTGQVKDYQLAR